MKEDYNGFNYSENEINKFINLSDEEYKKISGAVKTRFAIEGLKKTNRIIEEKLDDGEVIEKIVKARDISSIDAITISSMLGGTIGASMDYAVFKNLYFTNKRILLADTNVANEYLLDRSVNVEDILDIRFTNKHLKVMKNNEGVYQIKERMQTSKIIESVSFCVFTMIFIICYLKVIKGTAALCFIGQIVSVIAFLISIIREHTIDKVQLVSKDGTIYKMMIAGDKYKEIKDYMTGKKEGILLTYLRSDKSNEQ